MDSIKLIKPCEKYLLSYLAACRELQSAGITTNSFHNPDEFSSGRIVSFKGSRKAQKG